MIIVKIKAGLGNQMFQYAHGRALSLRSNVELKLDTTDWTKRGETFRKYTLSHFNIVETIATDEEIKKLRRPFGIVSKILEKIISLCHISNVTFYTLYLSKKNVYLDGFWQNESYFKDQADAIRKDFTPKTPLSAKTAAMLRTIEADPKAISLHIRRGDNAHNPSSMKAFGLCSMEYYENALRILSKKTGGALHLYIFSDEIDWAKENLTFPFPMTFVSAPEIADWEEILLMAACRHNILANSSFSWWGAWLNPRTDKVVIGPKQWALQNKHQYKHILPPSWLRI